VANYHERSTVKRDKVARGDETRHGFIVALLKCRSSLYRRILHQLNFLKYAKI